MPTGDLDHDHRYDPPAARAAEQLLAECDVRRLRRSGPGGQNRNKVETAICLHHRPSGVQAEANERRSQSQNQVVAMFRLRVNLALTVRVTAPLTPTALWRTRCAGGRVKVSATNRDFPSLLAEALDAIFAHAADVKAAAAALACTTSQLLRLLKLDARALMLVNRWRAERQLHELV